MQSLGKVQEDQSCSLPRRPETLLGHYEAVEQSGREPLCCVILGKLPDVSVPEFPIYEVEAFIVALVIVSSA